MSYSTPRRLTSSDDLTKFGCGEPSLDTWLRRRALNNDASGASATYVTTSSEGHVVGFYAIASSGIERADVPGRMRRNQPSLIPVILLARLGVDRNHQGGRLGSHLLRDAIVRCVRASEEIGVRAMLVHAMHDEARRFYLRYGFEPSPTDPLHLLLLIQDAREIVNATTTDPLF